jgi:hypothetical protein
MMTVRRQRAGFAPIPRRVPISAATKPRLRLVDRSVLDYRRLLILNRSRKLSPNLRPADRMVGGLCAVFMRPGRLIRSAIVFKPSTLLVVPSRVAADGGGRAERI